MKKIPNWVINLAIKFLGGGETMEKIKLLLAGKKTYLTALGMVVAALIQFSADGDVGTLVNKVIEAVALCSVRSAIG